VFFHNILRTGCFSFEYQTIFVLGNLLYGLFIHLQLLSATLLPLQAPLAPQLTLISFEEA